MEMIHVDVRGLEVWFAPRGRVSWRSGPIFGKMAVVAELAEAEKGGGGSGCVAPTVVDLYI